MTKKKRRNKRMRNSNSSNSNSSISSNSSSNIEDKNRLIVQLWTMHRVMQKVRIEIKDSFKK
jgi:hypothetical protein